MPPRRKAAVVFVHGLAKKPPPEKLKQIWLWGLERHGPKPEIFGVKNPGLDLADQGIPCFFTYWADVFYGENYQTDEQGQYEKNRSLDELTVADMQSLIGELSAPQPANPQEAQFLAAFEEKFAEPISVLPLAAAGATSICVQSESFEIASWLPQPIKQAIIRQLAMEAYYYLFNKEYQRIDGVRYWIRQTLQNRLLSDLHAAREVADKVVVVSHSMGSIIAYDVLRNVVNCPEIDALFTLGSPLGITEVQNELRAADASQVDFPATKVQRWLNVFDPLDPVCGADPRFANDYAPVDGKHIEDIHESNWGAWRHEITHYLAGVQFRTALAQVLGVSRP